MISFYTIPLPEGAIRLSGNGREGTAAAISAETYATAENVVIAGGDDYADALVGVPLASALDAPILLVRKSGLEQNTINELERLRAKNIYILGGSFAVSDETKTQLENLGYNVERIAGDNRFATAVEIAKKMDDVYEGEKSETVFFVYSHNYPDALAGGVFCAAKKAPLVLVDKTLDPTKNKNIVDYIKGYDPDHTYIFGGTFAVSQDIEDCLADILK